MKQGKLKLVLLGIIIVAFLAFPLSGSAQQPKKPQVEKAQTGFPTLDDLARKNVGLKMEWIVFGSGLQRDENGRLIMDNQGRNVCGGRGFEILLGGGGGSGFLVGRDGTIVTNYHVARMAIRGWAEFKDGASYEIKNIKVYDPISDIAILKISAERPFDHVTLGDSEKVDQMDRVLAVGKPMGGRTINTTEGMISEVVKDDYDKAVKIVHTAPITSGNSGGALYKGDKVIGVNVAVRVHPQFGGQTGFNHAVPINKAKKLLEDPQYNILIPLKAAFPPDAQKIFAKVREFGEPVAAEKGQVPGATGGKPGSWALKLRAYELEDLLISVTSQGKVGILVYDEGSQLIGCGKEGLFLGNDYPKNIIILVVNGDSQPANFGLSVFKINW